MDLSRRRSAGEVSAPDNISSPRPTSSASPGWNPGCRQPIGRRSGKHLDHPRRRNPRTSRSAHCSARRNASRSCRGSAPAVVSAGGTGDGKRPGTEAHRNLAVGTADRTARTRIFLDAARQQKSRGHYGRYCAPGAQAFITSNDIHISFVSCLFSIVSSGYNVQPYGVEGIAGAYRPMGSKPYYQITNWFSSTVSHICRNVQRIYPILLRYYSP